MNGARRPDLDGLRGLAVLLVVGFHAGIPTLRGAFVAVDVFFVLSGFFLATTLTQALARGEEIRPAALFTRRVWRLLPGLVVVLLGTLASTWLYAPIDRAAVAQHMVPVSAFAGNLAFAADGVNYFRAGENPLLHTWTLGVELQLALLLPLLVMLFAAWGGRLAADTTGAARRESIVRSVMLGLAVVAAISFTLAVVINDRAPMWAYFGPHTRLWSFCAGALMAFVTGGGQSAVGASTARVAIVQLAGLGLLVAPALLYGQTIEYPGVAALAPVGGTMLLLSVGGVAASALPGRILASAPLAALGKLSYGWYLWHWPLMVLGAIVVPDLGVAGKFAWGLGGLLAALITYRLLQRQGPVAMINRVMGQRPAVAAVAVSLGLAGVAAVAAWSNTRYVQQSVHREYRDARADHIGHDCWGGRARDRAEAACAFGETRSATTLALMGDSHASHWLGGLDQAGKQHGWRIEAHVMGACPVADMRGLLEGAATRLYAPCADFQEETVRRLAAARPHAILLSNADYYLRPPASRAMLPGIPESVWIEGLRRTYQRLEEMGIQVIVMRALPWVPFDVPSCLSRRAAQLPGSQDCAFSPDREFMARAQAAQTEAARGLSVQFVDMNDLVCGAGPAPCRTQRDGVVLYTDDNHITRSLSRAMSGELGRRLAALPVR